MVNLGLYSKIFLRAAIIGLTLLLTTATHSDAEEVTPAEWDTARIYSDSPNNSGPTDIFNGIQGSGNQAGLPTVNEFTGAAVQSIPIQVPPGRGKTTPQIALSYSSTNPNGWLGVGWNLEIGSIRRMTKFGLDYSGKSFEVLTGNGQFELIPRPDWGVNYYGAKIESEFTKYYFDGASFIATARDGVKYYYGYDRDSRESYANGIFQWKLDRIEDTNGNYMSVKYDRTVTYAFKQKAGMLTQELYVPLLPVKIEYSSNSKTTAMPYYSVEFTTEARTDTQISYKSHHRVETNQRLSDINVYMKVNGSKKNVTTYHIVYSERGEGKVSRIDHIDVTGYNENGTSKTLPTMSFEWTDGGDGSYVAKEAISLPATTHSLRVGDVNGDGRDDIVFPVETFISDGDGTFSRVANNIAWPCDWNTYAACKVYLADITGDNRSDLVIVDDYSGDIGYYGIVNYRNLYAYVANPDGTFGSNGNYNSKVQLPATYEANSLYDVVLYYLDLSFRDLDGDGSLDLIMRYQYAGFQYYRFSDTVDIKPGMFMQTAISEGDGKFAGMETLFFPDGDKASNVIELQDGNALLAIGDINNDGNSEIVLGGTYDSNNVRYLNKIQTYSLSSDGTFGIASSNNNAGYQSVTDTRIETSGMVDINNDGLMDILAIWKSSDPAVNETNLDYFLSKGDGSYEHYSGLPITIQCDNGYRCFLSYADVNGDSLIDVINRRKLILYNDKGEELGDIVYDEQVWLNNGMGAYSHDITRDKPLMTFEPSGTLVLDESSIYSDADGNGLIDRILIQRHIQNGVGDDIVTNWTMKPTLNTIPNKLDLLKSFSNGYGAKASIEYKSSSSYTNTFLPYKLPLVSRITVDVGTGDPQSDIAGATQSVTSFTYQGGLHDPATREFCGFEYVSRTNPDNTRTDTLFYQDDFKKGHVKELYFYEYVPSVPSYNLRSKTILTWQETPIGSSPYLGEIVQLQRQDITHFEEGGGVYTQEDYFYNPSSGHLETKTISGTGAENITLKNVYENKANNGWMWRLTEESITGKVNNSVIGLLKKTTYDYDTSKGNMMWKQYYLNGASPGTVIPDPSIKVLRYDLYGNPELLQDANGYQTETMYDNTIHTFPRKVTRPSTNGVSHITEYASYDYRFGKVKTMKDENNNNTNYQYDAFGRLAQVDYPDGGQVLKTYYDSAIPRYVLTQQKEDTSGNYIKTYEHFDGLGRSVQTFTCGELNKSVTTTKYYDVMGRNDRIDGPFYATTECSEVVFPKGYPAFFPSNEYTFDYFGRVLTSSMSDETYRNITTSYAYTGDVAGLKATITDPDGRVKDEITDHLGRLREVVEHVESGVLQHTSYDYNSLGKPIEIVDNAGNTTSFSYDRMGRTTDMTDPDMGAWHYTYDENSNLHTQKDGNNLTTTFEYDELNRLISKSYSTSGTNTVKYAYDTAWPNGVGRLASIDNTSTLPGSNSGVLISYNEYDPTGRLKSVSKSIAGNQAKTTLYDYDLSGKTTQITYPDGYVIKNNFYPGTNLLYTVEGVADTKKYATLSGYKPAGLIGTLSYGNGLVTSFDYDLGTGRLYETRTRNVANADIQWRTYAYTAAGDIWSVTNKLTGFEYQYDYDFLHRLRGETSADMSALNHEASIVNGFDSTLPVHAPKSVAIGSSSYSYTYDGNGNMTSGPNYSTPGSVINRLITYNAENMPVSVTRGNAFPVEFVYDGQNVRARKSTLTGETYYYNELFEVADGSPVKYVLAGNLRIAKLDVNGAYYFHKDHLGSSTTVTNESGAVVETSEALPFGGERSRSSRTEVSKYRFTDQEHDTETGLYNYKSRLYDPAAGRFVTPDPYMSPNLGSAVSGVVAKYMGTASGDMSSYFADPQRLNRYAYVRNNPLNATDPNGLLAFPWHYGITFVAAMNSGYSTWDSLKLAWDSTAVDFEANSQDIDIVSVMKHAMAIPGQSTAEAVANTEAYINYSGNLSDSLHATIDLATPLHYGKEWNGFGFNDESFTHILYDTFPSFDTILSAYQNVMNVLNQYPSINLSFYGAEINSCSWEYEDEM